MKVFAGIGLVLLLHLVALVISLTLSIQLNLMGGYFFLVYMVGFGLFQVIYVLPLAWYLKKQGQSEMLKGALIAAGLSLLLTGICGVALSL